MNPTPFLQCRAASTPRVAGVVGGDLIEPGIYAFSIFNCARDDSISIASREGTLARATGPEGWLNPYLEIAGNQEDLSDVQHVEWAGCCNAWWKAWDDEEGIRRSYQIAARKGPREYAPRTPSVGHSTDAWGRLAETPAMNNHPRAAWIDAFLLHVLCEVPLAAPGPLTAEAARLYGFFGQWDPTDVAEAEWCELPLAPA